MDPVGYEHYYWREPGHTKESFLDYGEWTERMRQGRWHLNEHESRFTTDIVFIKSIPLFDLSPDNE